MIIEFKKITNFERGLLHELLLKRYSFDEKIKKEWEKDWIEFDNFFFDNPQIAESCGFITTLNGEPIGFASWDPRNLPEYVIVGHNCIVPEHKGNGYGKIQLQEAVKRIFEREPEKIIVSTNEDLVPAQRMYESVGFQKIKTDRDDKSSNLVGNLIYYELTNAS